MNAAMSKAEFTFFCMQNGLTAKMPESNTIHLRSEAIDRDWIIRTDLQTVFTHGKANYTVETFGSYDELFATVMIPVLLA